MYEIMLPKKIQYQDFLFNSLVNGFRTFTFAGYFKENQESVRQLFEDYSDVLSSKKFDLELFDRDYKPVFQGYSMYEVYGVFRHEDSMAFDEELTHIIRVYFIPDYAEMGNRFPAFSQSEIFRYADAFFALSTNMYRRWQSIVDMEKLIEELGISFQKGHEELFNYLNNWIDSVALLVFGSIIHEICRNLSTCYEEDKIRALEKEIWVTSQWGILINKTILKE